MIWSGLRRNAQQSKDGQGVTNLAEHHVDTPFLSSIGKKKVSNKKFEWQTDSLATASATTAVEGDDASGASLGTTTRLYNYTAIFQKTVVISGTQEAQDNAGRGKESAYQVAKARHWPLQWKH